MQKIFFQLLIFVVLGTLPLAAADSDSTHGRRLAKTPTVAKWNHSYDISKLTATQQTLALHAMQRWMDTGAKIKFIPRTSEIEYVNFTGKTDAGNNTSHVGFIKGERTNINITAFWWRENEWMPAHELGHVLGFFHEHQRWDRDQSVTIHYENIKDGRASDYDWIPKTNWLVNTLPYDYKSIMHYRICWASKCEDECKDGIGNSPCTVISPVNTNYDGVIGQWTDNHLSALDAERARLAYGTNSVSTAEQWKVVAHGETVGLFFGEDFSPGWGDRNNQKTSIAPSGADFILLTFTHGFTVGY